MEGDGEEAVESDGGVEAQGSVEGSCWICCIDAAEMSWDFEAFA